MLHMHGACGNKCMNARGFCMFYGCPGAVNILCASTGKATYCGAFYQFRDFRHGLKIAIRGNGKACLNHIYPHRIQHLCHAQFLPQCHRGTGGLLAIAQSCIKNQHAVFGRAYFLCIMRFFSHISYLGIKQP